MILNKWHKPTTLKHCRWGRVRI